MSYLGSVHLVVAQVLGASLGRVPRHQAKVIHQTTARHLEALSKHLDSEALGTSSQHLAHTLAQTEATSLTLGECRLSAS